MAKQAIKIGIIDSGCRANLPAPFYCADFSDAPPNSSPWDTLGHGGDVAELIATAKAPVELYIARVFGTQLRCNNERIALALHWLQDHSVDIVNMSFGLVADRPAIRAALSRPLRRAPIYIASSPAQGQPVFPAAYTNVIGVSADGRCQPQQISQLRSKLADFGAAPRQPQLTTAGSSIACAQLSRALAEIIYSQGRHNCPGLYHQQLVKRCVYKRRCHTSKAPVEV